MRRRERRIGLAVALAALPILLSASRARAHELGVVQVTVELRSDGTCRVRQLVDLEHLPPLPDGRTDPDVFLRSVGERATLRFDGRAVSGRPRRSPVPDRPGYALLTLDLRTPPSSRQLTFENAAIPTPFLLTLAVEGHEPGRQWVAPGRASAPVPLDASVVPPARLSIVRQYLALGFTHILPRGLDHVLFVLGLFLLSMKLRPVLWQVTAFTVAHTLTLALTVNGVITLPSSVVEPLIALSIVYVAVENVLTDKLHAWRPAVVFAFGLLHGMGFAGVLSEIGLPRAEFVTALLAFNAGVEAGQVTVILAAYVAVGAWLGGFGWYRSRVVVPASLAIAGVGLWWSVKRAFLS